MNKIRVILIFILNSTLLYSQKSSNEIYIKNKYEIINLLFEKITTNDKKMPIIIYGFTGGKNFSNNLECRNQYKISKFINDSLHTKTKPSEFIIKIKKVPIDLKLLSKKYNFIIKNKKDSLTSNIVLISNPIFFNHNKNCFISYEIGDYNFGNIILSKETDKWNIKYIFCESTISY